MHSCNTTIILTRHILFCQNNRTSKKGKESGKKQTPKSKSSKKGKGSEKEQSKSSKKPKGSIITLTPHGGTIHPSVLTFTNSTTKQSPTITSAQPQGSLTVQLVVSTSQPVTSSTVSVKPVNSLTASVTSLTVSMTSSTVLNCDGICTNIPPVNQ